MVSNSFSTHMVVVVTQKIKPQLLEITKKTIKPACVTLINLSELLKTEAS